MSQINLPEIIPLPNWDLWQCRHGHRVSYHATQAHALNQARIWVTEERKQVERKGDEWSEETDYC